jgi:nucleotide-binding universal stress UspA family protein
MDRAILVPIDGSEPAWDALTFALEHHADADITAYYVISTMSAPDEAVIEQAYEHDDGINKARREYATDVLDDATQVAAEYGVDISTDYERGIPREAILDYAEDQDIDQIIMGSHGHTGLTRFMVGSTAEKVTRQAPAPVTIVRPEALAAD